MKRQDRPSKQGVTTVRASDLSWFLPFVGLLLLMPPLLSLFDEQRFVFGIPLLLFYLFAIWLIGILLTAWAAGRLQRASRSESTD